MAGFTPELNSADNAATTVLAVLNGGGGSLVIASNSAPVLAALPNRAVHAGTRIGFTAVATDADVPTNTLTFELLAGAPAAATIDPHSGEFAWQTTDADTGSTNTITVRVTDNGSPALADTKTFEVAVVSRPFIAGIMVHDGVVTVSWDAVPGQAYRLQSTTNLTAGIWEAAVPDIVAANDSVSQTNVVSSNPVQFFRVLVLP